MLFLMKWKLEIPFRCWCRNKWWRHRPQAKILRFLMQGEKPAKEELLQCCQLCAYLRKVEPILGKTKMCFTILPAIFSRKIHAKEKLSVFHGISPMLWTLIYVWFSDWSWSKFTWIEREREFMFHHLWESWNPWMTIVLIFRDF